MEQGRDHLGQVKMRFLVELRNTGAMLLIMACRFELELSEEFGCRAAHYMELHSRLYGSSDSSLFYGLSVKGSARSN